LYYRRLAEAATRAVEEDGAEVIVLGSTTMYRGRPYLAERLPAPVVDPAAALYKQAAAILSLRLSHSRKAFPAATQNRAGVVHRMDDALAESPGPRTPR
jgi:allantoin racemase